MQSLLVRLCYISPAHDRLRRYVPQQRYVHSAQGKLSFIGQTGLSCLLQPAGLVACAGGL